MNSLKQVSNGIFSTPKELKNLAAKDQAKILVLSDSHGNLNVLHHIIENHTNECDALMFAGDGVQDILEIIEEANGNKSLKEKLPATICFVKGNNDPYQHLSKFDHGSKFFSGIKRQDFFPTVIPKEVSLIAAGKQILMVHGHEQGVYYSHKALEERAVNTLSDVVLFGHTHSPEEIQGKICMMNPGSVSLPRQLPFPTFAYLFIQPRNVVYTSFMALKDRTKMLFSPFAPEKMF